MIDCQPLNLTVCKEFLEDGKTVSEIDVGNSGLYFEISSTYWWMHYGPDGFGLTGIIHPLKYSLVFGAALYEFLQWWQNPANFNSDFMQRDVVVGITNKRMHLFRKHLLNLPNQLRLYRQTAKIVHAEDFYSYRYRFLVEQAVNSQLLMDRLRRMKEACLRKNYVMEVCVDETMKDTLSETELQSVG